MGVKNRQRCGHKFSLLWSIVNFFQAFGWGGGVIIIAPSKIPPVPTYASLQFLGMCRPLSEMDDRSLIAKNNECPPIPFPPPPKMLLFDHGVWDCVLRNDARLYCAPLYPSTIGGSKSWHPPLFLFSFLFLVVGENGDSLFE